MKRIYNAFFYSLAGLRHALTREAAVQQEAALLLLGIPLSYVLANHWWQMGLLVGALVFVILVELLNTCIEKICDHVRPERHPDIAVIKDIGSAACFLAQCLAGAIWLAVLIQRIWG
jgi:diacylglycerol kinase (ATP)